MPDFAWANENLAERAAGQDGWNIQIKVNLTEVHDPMNHPIQPQPCLLNLPKIQTWTSSFLRWDTNIGSIVESRLKELHPVMPVMFIKAVTQDKQELRSLYDCPVYKTRQRGPTYVWTFNLKSKEKPAKWVLAGAALLLQI